MATRPRVYISACAADNAFAVAFVATFPAQGIEVLRSPADDDSFELTAAQQQMIGACNWFLVIQSPAAEVSQTVRAELAAATRLLSSAPGRGIISVMIAPSTLPLPPGTAARIQVLDASGQRRDAAMQQAIVLMRGAYAPPNLTPTHRGLPESAAAVAAPPRTSRRDLLIGGGIILAGLVVAGGTLLVRHLSQSQTSLPPSSSPTGHTPGTLLTMLIGHTDKVNSVAWSLDGGRIASASADATAKIWPSTGGGASFTYTGHGQSVNTVAWSHDHSRIASASDDGTIQLWQAAGGARQTTFTGHGRAVNAARWSPDDTLIASCAGDGLRIWQASDGSQIAEFANSAGFSDCAWSSDGRSVAASSFDTTVKIWDVTTHAQSVNFTNHSDRVFSVAWSPDGQLLASAGQGGHVHIWQADGNEVFSYTGHRNGVEGLAWSLDSRYVASGGGDDSGYGDTSVQVWEATNGTTIATYTGHARYINGVAWSPDGTRVVSGSDDGTAHIWWVR